MRHLIEVFNLSKIFSIAKEDSFHTKNFILQKKKHKFGYFIWIEVFLDIIIEVEKKIIVLFKNEIQGLVHSSFILFFFIESNIDLLESES